MSTEILLFQVDERLLGVQAPVVREVLRAATLTLLPKAVEGVEGLLNLRGSVIAVLNVRQLLGLSVRPIEHTDHFIVVHAGPRDVALRADHALDLIVLSDDDLESAAAVVASPAVEFVAKTTHGIAHIIDPNKLLPRGADNDLASVPASQLAETTP